MFVGLKIALKPHICSLEGDGTFTCKGGTGMDEKLLQVGPCTHTHIPTHPLQP